MRKIRKTMASVRSYQEAGMDEEVLGNSGRFVSWVDNGVRNIRGALRSFMPMPKEKGSVMSVDRAPNASRGYSGWSSWYERAKDPSDSIWDSFQLPEWARAISGEAQEHRAQILELAYMAARLAEPSNRGLSDKDIEAALARIAGDTSNPQQLMRRFVTIAAEAAFDLEDRLDSYKQSIPGIEDGQVDSYFGGKLLQDYRQRRQQLYTEFGVNFDEYGRPMFDEVLDIQVDPRTNEIRTPNTTIGDKDITEMTQEEKDKALEDLL
jgi:hypothetical protein